MTEPDTAGTKPAPRSEALDSIKRVLANRGLRRIQLAFFGSLLGDWAYGTAVTVWAYGQGGATAVGLYVGGALHLGGGRRSARSSHRGPRPPQGVHDHHRRDPCVPRGARRDLHRARPGARRGLRPGHRGRGRGCAVPLRPGRSDPAAGVASRRAHGVERGRRQPREHRDLPGSRDRCLAAARGRRPGRLLVQRRDLPLVDGHGVGRPRPRAGAGGAPTRGGRGRDLVRRGGDRRVHGGRPGASTCATWHSSPRRRD